MIKHKRSTDSYEESLSDYRESAIEALRRENTRLRDENENLRLLLMFRQADPNNSLDTLQTLLQ